MPVTMGGLASGMDTDGIIDKLLKVEARPIRKLEEDIRKTRKRKGALDKLKGKLKNLNSAARDLYGFRASYDEKKAISANSGILTAKASKLADIGEHKVEIIQIASNHKIATDSVEKDTRLPAGKISFTVNGEKYTIRFKGGKLKSLQEKIDDEVKDVIATSLVRTTGKNYILTLQSKVQGKKGEIKITGDKKLLSKTGLTGSELKKKLKDTALTFDRRYFTSYMGTKKTGKEDGKISVTPDGTGLNMSGLLWREYTLPVSIKAEKGTTLEFVFSYKKPLDEEDTVPKRNEMGPDERVVIKGIELHGYNISRLRDRKKQQPDKQFDSVIGVGVVTTAKDGKRIEKLYPVDEKSKGKQVLPVGRDMKNKKIEKVVFYCNDGNAAFSKAKIATPVKDKGGFKLKNEIAQAKDAKLKVNGVEITRDKNNDLNDIIKGVNFDIKMSSKVPVDLKVDHDIDVAMEKIKKFVNVYNDYLDFHRLLVKTGKSTKPGQHRERRRDQGVFVGDMTIVRIENMMKRTVNAAYPSRAETPVRILTQMGVSTGKINADWESIKLGKLIVDEEKLKKAIIDNPEGISMFFGSDTDGDNRTDNGMAFSLNRHLKAYIGFGKNILTSKLDLENQTIKLANERIERHTDHLKKYESKLRSKFGKMEKAISGANAQRNWMNAQMGNTGNRKGK